MEKILLAVDTVPINKQTLYFACYLADLTNSKLVGIFPAYNSPCVETILAGKVEENRASMSVMEKNIQIFEAVCAGRHIMPYIHRNSGDPVNEIFKETRFADLLIVDSPLTGTDNLNSTLSGFLKEILAKSECPVVIAPPDFTDIEEIVFAYDGSASSVFAMKQFSYLFPGLSNCRLTIVQVNAKEKAEITEIQKVIELLQMHYSAIGYHHLKGKTIEELYKFLVNKEKTFVVMGAFGRNSLSTFLKHSTAELLIQKINLPLFIAHH
jgi:nucleotide-binding universal stress UspA family protein